jgi:hypothetical protein
MRIRRLIVFATTAALLGAPSIASGAGDSSASLSATPSSGTVETGFSFRLAYEGQFSAAAMAAPRIVPAADRTDQGEGTHAGASEGVLGIILLVGLSGVTAVAIIGFALLVIRRRRSEGPEAAGAVNGTAEADTEALLQRRIVRRAKIRLADDPIVAAMGVDDQVDARRRRDAGRPPAGDPRDRRPSGRP